MTDKLRYFPHVVIGGAVLWLIAAARPPSEPDGRMQIHELGSIPVVDRGRTKPLDTYARTTLMVLNNKQTFTDQKDDKYPAILWLLELVTTHPSDRLLRIEHPKIAALLGLEPEEAMGRVFRAGDLGRKERQALAKEFAAVQAKDPQQWTEYDRAVLDLAGGLIREEELDISDNSGTADHLKIFRIENEEVLALLGLESRPGWWRYSYKEIHPQRMKLEERALLARQKPDKDRPLVDQKALDLYNHVQLYLDAARLQTLLLVPPPEGEEEWQPLSKGILAAVVAGDKDAPALKLREIFRAYRDDDTQGFNRAVAEYRAEMEKRYPHASSDARTEAWFNAFSPFYQCTLLYALIFVLVCASWAGWTSVLNRTAFGLAVLTLAVHTAALILRMYLQGRPPVTNLYSSAVFIGWGCLVLCLVLEWVFANGIGNLVGAVLGFNTMLVAHHLAESGDTLEMMQAVLDTNFWLATHVTCISLGYTTMFVAGMIGIVYIVRGVLTPTLTQQAGKELGQMMYGVLCFAVLLSFVGTVLGGIWADQSWGRFWGWDPKENGALLIVVWSALILHARWAGMVRTRGMALLAIGGNMVTAWSWFGTNQLQVGLHSYGFSNTLATGLVIFWASQVLFLGIGLIPVQNWWSYPALQGLTPVPAVAPVLAAEGPRIPPGPRLPRDKRRRK